MTGTFNGKQVSVATTGQTLISQAGATPLEVYVRNHDGANPVYLGNATVTNDGGGQIGFALKAGESYGPVTLPPGVALYGQAKTSAVTLDVTERQW